MRPSFIIAASPLFDHYSGLGQASEYFGIQKKLEVLELADKLQNVSEAARLSGVSRDTIYRHPKLIREGGVQALKRQVRADHIHQNRTDQEVAGTVIELLFIGTIYLLVLLIIQTNIDLLSRLIHHATSHMSI